MSENIISSEYEIDEDIRDLVEFCNNNGIKTLASCSGTLKDHENLDVFGQLNIKDSELSRKIVAVIIESGICDTSLFSKPVEEWQLYDNIISYSRINFSFKNPNNDVLPKIEEIIHQVVEKKLEPKLETMDKLKQVFDFFDSIDRKIESSYRVSTPDFCGELTFETENIESRRRVDKEYVVEYLANATGCPRVDHGYYIGIITQGNENLQDILSKAKIAIKKAPNISRRREIKKDRERESKNWREHANNEKTQNFCKTSQSLDELLGKTNTPEETDTYYRADVPESSNEIKENVLPDSIPVNILEEWENL